MIPAMQKAYRAAQSDPQGYWAYIAIIGRSVIPPELLPETRVLNKLDELGLAQNTLVIFTTDHGDMAGAHGCIGKCTEGYSDDLVRTTWFGFPC